MNHHAKTSGISCAAAGAGALILCLGLAACGGGGGGGSNSGGGTPPPPPITYHGATALAPASTTSAPSFGVGVVYDANNVRGLVAGIDTVAPGTYDKTVSCPNGGSAHVTGTINSDGSGTLNEDYSACREEENGVTVTLNGLVVLVYGTRSVNQAVNVDVQFRNADVIGGGENLALTGDVSKVSTSLASGMSNVFVANLLLTDNSTGEQIWMHPLSIDDELDTREFGQFDTTLSGQYYLSPYGRMSVATSAILHYEQAAEQPYGGGPITLSGAGGHVVLAPLNTDYASLGLDFDGDGRVELGNLFDWATGSFHVDNNLAAGPVADARSYIGGEVGVPTNFDARMSRERGDDYLSYHWQLLLSPAGSAVTLSHANEAQASLTPDLDGDYLARLTVTDRQGHSNAATIRLDTLAVRAATSGAADPGPDETAEVGQLVALDGSMSISDPETSGFSYYWTLTAPPDSQATLQDPDTATPSFTPDVPGIYELRLADNNVSKVLPAKKLVSTSGNSAHFDFAEFYTPQNVSYERGGDLNDDGKADIAVSGTGGVGWLRNEGGGKFSAPVPLTSARTSRDIAIGDLNGDGLNDMAVGLAGNADAQVFLQQPDGPGPAEPWVRNGGNNHGGRILTIAPLFGQPWNSLWIGISSGVEVPYSLYAAFDLNGDGNQDPQYVFTDLENSWTVNDYVLADINGDGILDLVYQVQQSGGTFGLVLSLGRAGGSFGAITTYSSTKGYLAAMDLDGDGRADILNLVPVAPVQLVVRYGQNNGQLSRATAYTVQPSSGGDIGCLSTVRLSGKSRPVPAFFNGVFSYFDVNSDGTLGMQWVYPLPVPIHCHFNPRMPQSIDINGDGMPDLFTLGAVMFSSPWPAQAAAAVPQGEAARSPQLLPAAAAARPVAGAGRLLSPWWMVEVPYR